MSVVELPPNILRRRELEDRAIELGVERRDLEAKRDGNLGAIVGLTHDAEGVLPLDDVAQLVGVSRQTLYRWREDHITGQLAPGDANAEVRELIPPADVFQDGRTQPTLRQAIVLVLMKRPQTRVWRPVEVIEALDKAGWLPRAKSGGQMVRNRMKSMVDKGELVRDGFGNYSLAPDIRNTGLLRVE